ncbi:U7 snRNA-associated Sm-like protein LSm10 [Thrips palmi]|uniref:U7 snRNA-associated Sm-like protein LSm10 n=1 Tax=Thrips palmi TaxID=161013 RepID=A0A6P9A9G0_THRPL|nr:U7 snRNA-associated Sm-like protein LSm10 [Thrips palmi]
MEAGLPSKEKHLCYNTLVCLLMTLKGQQTTVDLRNGASVTGKIVRCDPYMNVDMSHVLFRDASGKPHLFDNFFVHARNLRYVHIPPHIDMLKSVETFVNRSQVKQDKQVVKPKTLRRQAETVERVRKLKEKRQMKKEES